MVGGLSEEQQRFFEREGYVFPLDCLTEDAAAARLDELQSWERRWPGGFGQRLRFKAHLRLTRLMELVRHPRVLDAVEDIIGPNILFFTSTLWPKSPSDRRFVSWHQDSAYFGLEPHREVTAWIALTASDHGNGCVRVMPQSHLGPDYAHDETRAPDNMLIRGQTIHGLDESKAIDLTLRPGQFSLHSELSLISRHGAGLNSAPAATPPAHLNTSRREFFICGNPGNCAPDLAGGGDWALHPLAQFLGAADRLCGWNSGGHMDGCFGEFHRHLSAYDRRLDLPLLHCVINRGA